MPRGYRGTGLDWLHVTIFVKPSEWDKFNYFSASTGKSVSQWVIDTLLDFDGTIPADLKAKRKAVKEKGVVRPLCVPRDKWDIIKERAEKLDMNISNYVLGVLLYQD